MEELNYYIEECKGIKLENTKRYLQKKIKSSKREIKVVRFKNKKNSEFTTICSWKIINENTEDMEDILTINYSLDNLLVDFENSTYYFTDLLEDFFTSTEEREEIKREIVKKINEDIANILFDDLNTITYSKTNNPHIKFTKISKEKAMELSNEK